MTHPIGPGQPPPLRDEPVAHAIWCALVRVRDAFDWTDVARDVEQQLRACGIVGDVHDRLIRAEREANSFAATNGALRAQMAANAARQARAADPVKGYLDRLRGMDPSPRMLAYIDEVEAERRD